MKAQQVGEKEYGFSRTVVAAVDAQAMLSVVGKNSAMNEVATEVNERLRRLVGANSAMNEVALEVNERLRRIIEQV